MKNLILAAAVFTQIANTQAAFRVHEWGTFTSMVGSNGVTIHGMYHEDEVLPDFVHGFGEVATRVRPRPRPRPEPDEPRPCRGKSCFDDAFYLNNTITQKMETPVIYFYSDERRDVAVNVRFPEGILTETYPAPIRSFPERSENPVLANGEMTFNVEVLPTLTGNVPAVPQGNIYGHARNVQSNIVRSGSEEEKFIFYRGLGRFQPRIRIESRGGELSLSAAEKDRAVASFLVHVNESGDAQMLELGDLRSTLLDRSLLEDLQNHDDRTRRQIFAGTRVRQKLIRSLAEAGLHLDEATSMIDTWESGYLRVPGLRLLYVLPRQEVDQILPLSINPQPDELQRVFVGRIEVLLDTEESSILLDVLMNGNQFDVSSLGRFAEPKLRRVREVYVGQGGGPAPEVLGLLDRLIDQARVPQAPL